MANLDGTRILVLTTHEAIEPIRYEGRIRWRVNDNCVDIDPTSWHAGQLGRTGMDWSAQPSGHVLDDASPVAAEIARRYLHAAGDEASLDLASATDRDLLRRLNVATGDGRLTNAGSLLFVRTPEVGIDYIRRDLPGGDSVNRIRSSRPLIEQVWDVDQASQAANRLVHVPEGFAHGQQRAIPIRAIREVIVNGVVHRDWLSPEPTTVEHVGDTLTVTSPGGFIGGITPSNIITHPAVPRCRCLAEAMASLRLGEREGIGVDRMVRDMLAIGRPEPGISEIAGPYVRVSLVGGDPDAEVVEFLASIEPASVTADLDALLLIECLTAAGWIDTPSAAPSLQRAEIETEAAIVRLTAARVGRDLVLTPCNPGSERLRLRRSTRERSPDPAVAAREAAPVAVPVAYALQVSSAASPASSATITGASCCSATGSGRPAGSGGSRPGTPTRGERHEDTIAREVREETGLTVKAGRLLKVRSGFQYRIEIYDEANLIGGVDGLASTRRKSWKPGCSTSTICRP